MNGSSRGCDWKMQKKPARSRVKCGKTKESPGSHLLQDMNFLCLKEFYNSIPDYSDINHLPEKEFYEELDNLKKKQQELTCLKKKTRRARPRSSHPHPPCEFEKKNFTERISFADDGNSISSWQLEFGSITCSTNKQPKQRENGNSSRLSSASRSRPQTSRAESRCRKLQQSRLSNIQDDYELLRELKSCRSKSISPTRSQINQQLKHLERVHHHSNEERRHHHNTVQNLYVGKPPPRPPPAEPKRDPIKDIPITSRIPLFDKVMEDQARSKSAQRCLGRSFSSPHLRMSDDDDESIVADECGEAAGASSHAFKAKPFPKNLFCNVYHYKMWEDNYFRALNKKLRAEELMRISKLPPAMAKREDENKKKLDVLEDFDAAHSETPDVTKSHDIAAQTKMTMKKMKKLSSRRKPKRSKSALATSSVQSKYRNIETLKSSKTSLMDSRASDITETDKASYKRDHHHQHHHHRDDTKSNVSITPAPIYPVNRPNLAATLRFQWSRKKLQKFKEHKEKLNRENQSRPCWGVSRTHAFQQLRSEMTHEEEIALRLATRRAEQKLRHEEHEMNMEVMRQRVKTAPLLLEGPPQLGARLGHLYHHCDIADDKKKVNSMLTQQNVTGKSKQPTSAKGNHAFRAPDSMISTEDECKHSEMGSINSKYS